jgi:hypothetical protein
VRDVLSPLGSHAILVFLDLRLVFQQDATRQLNISVAGGLIQIDGMVKRASQTLANQKAGFAVTPEQIVSALSRIADIVDQRKDSLASTASFMDYRAEHPATLADHENADVTIRLLGSYSVNHRVLTEVNLGLQTLLAPRLETATPSASPAQTTALGQQSPRRARFLFELVTLRVGDDIQSKVNSAAVENLLYKLLLSELSAPAERSGEGDVNVPDEPSVGEPNFADRRGGVQH